MTWCYDRSESFVAENLGVGLAYLAWAIADLHGKAPFDASVGDGLYDPLVRLLKENPNGLWDKLVEEGFIVVRK